MGPDLEIKALAMGRVKGALSIDPNLILTPPFESRRFLRYIRIFLTLVADCVGQWQYLVVWRLIFSERVVIFSAFVD